MTTPILRDNGTQVTLTSTHTTANNAYANIGDAMRLQVSALSFAALVADFRLTSVVFATAPVGGVLQLVAVDRDFAGNQGPTPSSTMQGRVVGTFTPTPQASNASTGWIMAIEKVALSYDADYWIYNNGTAYTLNAGWVLTALPWSPGT